MPNIPDIPDGPADLRGRAAARVTEAGKELPHSEADLQRLLHELQVHQIELELQNEELQRARDEMAASLAKYSDLYDFAPVSYLTLDREGNIQAANLTAASLLGMERSRLIGLSFKNLVTEPDRKTFADFLGDVFEAKTKSSCEVVLVRPGKDTVDVRIRAEAAPSRLECRIVVSDITEGKQAEVDRLILSKLESTGILAGGIAHDFNNLLTVILLQLELAGMPEISAEELTKRLDEAKNTALMARGLTQQLITFSQGGAPVRKATLLAEVIEGAVRPALSGARVRSEFSIANDLWVVEVDEGQIRQVIWNLVLNAREAMPEGGVVSIRAENAPRDAQTSSLLPPRDCVRVSVADQGAGIPKAVLPKIFDPYFSTKQRGTQKGMGLGLTICHSVVQRHGGVITVESELGAGTTFHVYLPAARGLVAATVTASGPTTFRRRARILVMDDEEAVRRVVDAALRRLGHEVELVADGERAIEVYRHAKNSERPFALVLLDLTVRAGLGGQEALKRLLTYDPDVKAIVMSGYANDPVMLDPTGHGFVGVLQKPFDIAALKKGVAAVLPK